MPPRTRRSETPDRRDARVLKHLAQARDYRSKWPAYLAEGDVCQAGEKGWGTVAQLTKAVATLRGWEHYDHEAIRDAITPLIGEMPQRGLDIARGLAAAERLHGNFYEVFMTLELARFALEDVRPLLDILMGIIARAIYRRGIVRPVGGARLIVLE